MRVKFKGSETTYECTEPIEQKVFRSGVAIGWAIMFHIYGDVDSSKVDEIVTPETIRSLHSPTMMNSRRHLRLTAIRWLQLVPSGTKQQPL